MAGQTVKSGILAGLGGELAKAHAESMQNEPSYGNPVMPAGIEGGIAQLRDCKIDIYKEGKYQGKPYFMAAGIAVEPEKHEGKPVAGLRTQIGPLHLCASVEKDDEGNPQKTFADQYNKMLNHLRILGLDEFLKTLVGKPADVVEQGLLNGMAALTKPPEKGQPDTRPYFRFRTWKGKEQDIVKEGGEWLCKERGSGKVLGRFRTEEQAKKKYPYAGRDALVTHEWNGKCEYNPHQGLPTDPDEIQDSSTSPAPQPSANGSGGRNTPSPASAQAMDDSDGAIADLVAQATNGDEQAKKQLDKMARSVGATPEQIDKAENWADVYKLITGNDYVAPESSVNPPATPDSAPDLPTADVPDPSSSQEPSQDSGEEELPPPQVGEKYKYQVLGKDGQPAKGRNKQPLPPIECTVKSVDIENATVELVAPDGKTTYNCTWDDLVI